MTKPRVRSLLREPKLPCDDPALTAPGPKGHRITGNLREYRRDPLSFLTRCAREYGDVVRLRFLHFPIYLVNRPELVEEVLITQRDLFIKGRARRASNRVMGNGLLTSEGRSWRRQRRMAQGMFQAERVAGYCDIIVSCAERMLAGWSDGETRDICKEMSRLTLGIAAMILFKTDLTPQAPKIAEALEVLREHFMSLTIFSFLPEIIPTRRNLLFRGAIKTLDGIIYSIIQRRRLDPARGNDLLSLLLGAQGDDGRPLDARQLRDELLTLLLATHETTAVALAWIWYLLSQHPSVEKKLTEELIRELQGRVPHAADLPRLTYTRFVMTEALRLYPPVYAIGRQALQDCTIGGYRIPAGASVFFSQWVMHRDPRFFDEPEKFDPDRWAHGLSRRLPLFAYFPFGGGPRFCVGAPFAEAEILLLCALIAQRYRLEVKLPQAITPQPSITIWPKHGIKVGLTSRVAA